MAMRVAAAILLLTASTLSAQDVAGRPQHWGTSSNSILTVQAFAFDAQSGDGAALQGNASFARFCTNPCELIAPVALPSGASIVAVELEACDFSPTGQITVGVYQSRVLEGVVVNLATTMTGIATTPGCSFFSAPANHTVDNFDANYIVQVFVGGIDGTTRFHSVRLYYRLQVSPAPATATFSDVPVGSSIHRFVEALAASGITAGCGGGNYCPNAPLTRGQMAVFLATALGLHFPN